MEITIFIFSLLLRRVDIACISGLQKKKVDAEVRGRIYDMSTGEPLRGKIELIKDKDTLITFSDSISGIFSLRLKKKGIYILRVTSPGYSWQEMGVVVDTSGIYSINFALKEKRGFSILELHIYDLRTGEDLKDAYAYIGDHIKVSDEHGYICDTLKTGSYPLKITRDGYYDYSSYLILEYGKNKFDFPLVPKEER